MVNHMNVRELISREMNRESDPIQVIPVPADKRPREADLRKLDREIKSQCNVYHAKKITF